MSDTPKKRNDLMKHWKDIVDSLEDTFATYQHVLRSDLDDFTFHERCSKCREELNDLEKKKNNFLTICTKDLAMLRCLGHEIEQTFPGFEGWPKSLKVEYDALSNRRSESLDTLESYQSHYRNFLKKAISEEYWETTVDRIKIYMLKYKYEMRTDLEGLSPTERAEICNAELAILEKKKDKLKKYTKQDLEFLAKLVDERKLEFPEDKDRYDKMNNGHIAIMKRRDNLIALLSSYEEKYRGYLAADKDSS